MPELHGETVLYAGQDRFAAYELLGADTDVPLVEFPDPDVVESPTKPFDTGDAYSPIDFDSFTYCDAQPPQLRDHRLGRLEQPGAAQLQGDRPHAVLHPLASGSGKTPQDRQTLLEGTEPAAPVDCAAPGDADLRRPPGAASIFPDSGDRPEGRLGRRPDARAPARATAQTLDLPAGRWRLSLQYFSPVRPDPERARASAGR